MLSISHSSANKGGTGKTFPKNSPNAASAEAVEALLYD
jgi:hypothetical protein